MNRLLTSIALVFALITVGARAETSAQFEQRVRGMVQGDQVTVVHFWAPWCPNCHAELSSGGWRDFIAANPNVKVIFITIWNDADGRAALGKFGVGQEPNFTLLLHPNTSRRRGEKVSSLLGIPLTWIPSTWVFKGGSLRYALNYGELRFPMLQQLVEDSSNAWKH